MRRGRVTSEQGDGTSAFFQQPRGQAPPQAAQSSGDEIACAGVEAQWPIRWGKLISCPDDTRNVLLARTQRQHVFLSRTEQRSEQHRIPDIGRIEVEEATP